MSIFTPARSIARLFVPTEAPPSYEDFTTYTKVDPNSYLTVTTNKVSWANLRVPVKVYLYKDKGAGYFNGDFDHKFEFRTTWSPIGDDTPTPVCQWLLSNDLDNYYGLVEGGKDALCLRTYYDEAQELLKVRLCVLENGVVTYDEWTGATLGTVYFAEVVRDDDGGANGTGRMTAYIRTGSHAGELVDTLQVDCGVGEQNDFRYVFGMNLMYYFPGDDNFHATGYTERLEGVTIPVVDVTVTPSALEVIATLYAPDTAVDVTVVPSTLVIVATLYAPDVAFDHTVVPSTLEVIATLYAPTIIAGAVDVTVTPDALETVATLYAPSVTIPYAGIPPFIQKDLIDSYSGGAWLWLVEIVIPGYDVRRIARDTKDVVYGGVDFSKGNFDVGQQSLEGGGSVPQVVLRVAQDPDHELEDVVNATQGGENGTVKLIRTCEKFLDTPVAALEAKFDILTADSDTEWVTLTLGIPSPLTQRIPLRIYSSTVCPNATPTLFKSIRCRLDPGHPDDTCTGTYEDCHGKGNAEHWGGELGLDPNALRA